MADDDKELSERPPPGTYSKYAFLNPYNMSLLAGAGIAALATGFWPLAVVAAAGEAIWMLFAPDSKLLQKVWFDKAWERQVEEKRNEIRDQKLMLLSPEARERVFRLRAQKERILRLANENPSFAGQLLRGELSRLGDVVDDFIDVSGVCGRYDEHLRTIDTNELESQHRRFERELERFSDGDSRREMAQKNLEVVVKRLARADELKTYLGTAKGQLDLMENTFRLLADEIVSMRSPGELGARLDDLRSGVEAVRETAKETERPYLEAEGIRL
ncbi:MAG: hypothetical protein U1E65_01915 [Myxococcota bacterium]